MELVKWENWPHIDRMQDLSREALMAIIRHSAAFAKAMMEDRSLKPIRLSSVHRRNRDNEKVQRQVRTLFYQPSSRTEGTFETAAQLLGCSRHHVRDPKTQSSAAKGESFELAIMAYTTAGGLQHLRGCDCVIIRHDEEGMSTRARKFLEIALKADGHRKIPVPVINAGDGCKGQHPSQTVVDLTTIYLQGGCNPNFLDGMNILFSGELHRNRTVNSKLYGLGKFAETANIKVTFCCPADARPDVDMLGYLSRHRVQYEFRLPSEFRDSIPHATVIYMTRPQDEYKDSNGQRAKKDPVVIAQERQQLRFRAEYLNIMAKDAFLMHPLPINEDPSNPPPEIDSELNPMAMAGDRRLVYPRQSHFGLPVRAAWLDMIFAGLDREADEMYGRKSAS